MIAHYGFTRAGRPRDYAQEIADGIAKKYPSAPPVPAPAAPAPFTAGHSMGSALTGISVPMAMHLEHLEITAAASRNFWFPIGVMTGFVLFLAGAYLHNLRILP